MEKLIKEVQQLVEEEYGRAGAKFGLVNNSDHESYAVMLEEVEEAKAEMSAVEFTLGQFWGFVKRNEPDCYKVDALRKLQHRALLGACELIQVAAMAKKASMTICNIGATEEFKEGGKSSS